MLFFRGYFSNLGAFCGGDFSNLGAFYAVILVVWALFLLFFLSYLIGFQLFIC